MAQIVTNTPLVERNARYGRWITTASLLVILTPLALTFPALFSGKNDMPTETIFIMYGALLLGLILSNVGGYFLNRWGLKNYEQVIDALKGTDKKYRLYNYSLPAPNVLLTPYGVTVLLLKTLEGNITANASGWKINFSLMRIIRWFSTEQLGDPTKALAAHEETMRVFITEHLGANAVPLIDGLIVFTSPRANVQVTNADLPVVIMKESEDALKNALKKPKNAQQLSKEQYDTLFGLFQEEADIRRAEAERGLVIGGRKIF
jgi:hypothetical protein